LKMLSESIMDYHYPCFAREVAIVFCVKGKGSMLYFHKFCDPSWNFKGVFCAHWRPSLSMVNEQYNYYMHTALMEWVVLHIFHCTVRNYGLLLSADHPPKFAKWGVKHWLRAITIEHITFDDLLSDIRRSSNLCLCTYIFGFLWK
jgi:hypothetical protein